MSPLVAGLFAGLVAIAVTHGIERLGGRVGGVLGTVPTTIVPAAWGIYDPADPAGFQAAMGLVPLGMLQNAVFLWLWRVVPPRLPAGSLGLRLALMSTVSVSAWFGLAAIDLVLVAAARTRGVDPAWIGGAAWVATVGTGVAACWRPLPSPRGHHRVNVATLAARGALAALAVAVAVAIARAGVPLLSGMAAVFPAIFLTSMISLWSAQGEAVPVGAVGPMMLGSASVGAYALFALGTLPTLGPAAGSLAAWALAVVLVTAPAAAWLRR